MADNPNQIPLLPTLEVEVRELNKATGTVTIVADKSYMAKARGRLTPYKSLPYLFRPVLEKLGEYVRTEMIPRVFEREGPGWAPLARRTVAERIQAGYGGQHPILRRSGDLFRELTDKSHPKHIEIIKTGKNARIEVGGSSQKWIQNQLGEGDPGQRLPRRSMIPGTGNLPIEARDRMAMEAIVHRAMRERLR